MIAIRPLRLYPYIIVDCGSGCCSLIELSDEPKEIKIGEEFNGYEYAIGDLEPGLDYW